MHVTQRLDATAEITALMSVSENIISPQKSNTTLALIQDVIVGLHKMSDPTCMIDADEAMQHLMQLRYFEFEMTENLHKNTQVAARVLVNAVLPKGLFFDQSGAQIEGGVLVSGRLTKKACSALIGVIARDFGGDAAVRFMSDAQRLAISFLFVDGFSCSMDDCSSDTSASAKQAMDAVLGTTPPNEVGEEAVMEHLQRAMDVAGSAADRGSRAANFSTMIQSGAKGTVINKLQIQGCVGQQTVAGSRILSGGSLPCMLPEDARKPTAQGFVASSYRDGLCASEYFFHLMGGREGLVDTAVKTARTGYIERRVIKFVENAKVDWAGGVSNANGDLVQRLYGGDGFCAESLEPAVVPAVLDPGKWAGCSGALATIGAAACKEIRLARSTFTHAPTTTVYVPGHVERWLKREAEVHAPGQRPENSSSVVQRLLRMLPPQRAHFCWAMRTFSVEDELVSHALEWYETKSLAARVPSGYSPGIIAAQALGHPITQMTLNTFHVSARSAPRRARSSIQLTSRDFGDAGRRAWVRPCVRGSSAVGRGLGCLSKHRHAVHASAAAPSAERLRRMRRHCRGACGRTRDVEIHPIVRSRGHRLSCNT